MQAPCLHQSQVRQRTLGAPLGGKPTSSCPSLSSEGQVNPTEYCWAAQCFQRDSAGTAGVVNTGALRGALGYACTARDNLS